MLVKMIYFVFSYRKYRMKYIQTEIAGLWIIEPKVLSDSRGYFMESFKQEVFNQNVGKVDFIQENESGFSRGVLRGLHYQLAPYSQAKLVRVIEGTVLDVAVDLRKGSPTFGKYMAVELSGQNKRQFYIPQGFAHGFHVLSERAVFTYKVDNPYMPSHERSLRFDDPQIGIDWQITDPENVILSEKDKTAPLLAEADINYIY